MDAARRWLNESESILSNPQSWRLKKGSRTSSGKFSPNTMVLTNEAKLELKRESKIVAGDLNTMVKMFLSGS